jgi:amyloid beta precursor protein binding protein 1
MIWIVIEAHPDNELPDLRLDQPFDELKAHCNSIELEKLSETDHSHIPYLIILFKYLESWKSQVVVLHLKWKLWIGYKNFYNLE